MEDIKQFRQWGAVTADTQSMGMPMVLRPPPDHWSGLCKWRWYGDGRRWLRENVSTDLVDHYTYVMCGDGCLMGG